MTGRTTAAGGSSHETASVRVGRTRVRVRTRGSGEPLLLCMGLGGHLDMWQPLAEHLPGRLLVMFDFPGAGESTRSWLPPTMAHNALFVRMLMAELGLARADVLGWSWGGLLAQQLAAQHPSAVRRLVLASTAVGWGSLPGRPGAVARLLTPHRYYDAEYLERIAPSTFGGRIRRAPELVREEAARRAAHPPEVRGYLLQLAATLAYSSLPVLPWVSARTLVLAGDDDPIIATGNQHLLHALLRRSRLEIVPGGGHLLLVDSAPDVAPLIERFLAEP